MLLKTRFYLPPLREHSVFRTELIDRLNRSSGGQLVLIAAPAGYGKSTLVSQWLHYRPHTFAWLTLDKTHNSPLQFWKYILNALQGIQPSVGIEAKTLIEQKDTPPLSNIVISLLNDLDQLSGHNDTQQAISLVLDDFHLMENQQLLNLITLFVDHLPPGIRLVITSREAPPLSLAKRRANNQLIELNIKDLAFSVEESKDFFANAMSLTIAPDSVTKLFEDTEGWVAGLQLAALSLKGGHNPLDTCNSETLLKHHSLDRHIEDYLLEEVFSLQNKEMQIFLTLTSVPSRFCAGLANRLTPENNSQIQILKLEQANLFLVPLDNHRTWYRYHDLFRQFLLQRFQLLPVKTQLELHQKAGQWYEQFGYVEEAIEHQIKAEQWDIAVNLIKGLVACENSSPEPDQIARWLSQLPADQAGSLPQPPKSSATTPDTGKQPDLAIYTTLVKGAEPLTQREKEVLTLVTQGLSNKLIAENLHISLNTLKVHIRNLYGKMGVESRTQALVKVNQHKLEY
ncbi:helix-turn-helix transcriptional regulator [Alkalimarinus coralli]|uniref:helix-turn-helix transcriptional regulator n=1 Tax=Alkalimarinus coralli TaxID=2935863 RepID=UPI00202B5DE5|nr:helix-turn-helix transcriptional regulator [Alkalimarinus coralli]